MKYQTQRQLNNLPEVVKEDYKFGEFDEYRLNKAIPKERFLTMIELQEIIEKYFK
jgi:hypothetical protein